MRNMLAYPADGLGPQPAVVHTVRITRSAPGPHNTVVAIGTAYSVISGVVEGVLTVLPAGAAAGVLTNAAGTVPVTPLKYTASTGDVLQLTCPVAVRAVPTLGVAIVVGSGVVQPASGGPDVPGPAVAVVTLGPPWTNTAAGNGVSACSSCGCGGSGACPACVLSKGAVQCCGGGLPVIVYVGAGDDDEFAAAVKYTDIVPSPCDPTATSWLVCGDVVVTDTGRSAAALWRLGAEFFDAQARVVLDLDGTTTGYLDSETHAVSLATTPGPTPCVLVGTHVTDEVSPALTQSLLWPVAVTALALEPVLPWTATGYNAQTPATRPALQLGPGALGVTLLRVFAVPTGAVYVAARAELDTTLSLPLYAVQVLAFTSDTTPDAAYGIDGVSTWFEPTSGASMPTDATLVLGCTVPCGRPSIVVAGNSFLSTPQPYNPPDVIDTYVTPCAPYLNTTAVDLPAPFLVDFRGAAAGSPVPLLCALAGCAPLHYASSFCMYAPDAGMLVGDTSFHVGCPSQAAGLLALNFQFGSSCISGGLRITNRQAVTVPVVNTECDGLVTVDTKCTSTTLLVRGALVVGCQCDDAPALPGTIRFNPDSRTFEGFDGERWLPFTTAG